MYGLLLVDNPIFSRYICAISALLTVLFLYLPRYLRAIPSLTGSYPMHKWEARRDPAQGSNEGGRTVGAVADVGPG